MPNPRHPVTLTQVNLTGRTHIASGAYLGTQTSSKLDLSKTKFVSLDLRTFSEMSSARFTKCAPQLNLKSCLGQATHSMPLLIVWSKENKVLNWLHQMALRPSLVPTMSNHPLKTETISTIKST